MDSDLLCGILDRRKLKMSDDKLADFQKEEEHREYLEQRDVLLAIGLLLRMKEGQQVFKYLFKTLDVTRLPEQGLEDNLLHECLGFLRAGRSVYELICAADFEIAASLISKLEREKYEHTYEQYRNYND